MQQRIASTARAGGSSRLEHHVRDEQRRLVLNKAGAPVTVTVSPWWAPVSAIPAGPRCDMRTVIIPQPAPSHAALERVVDHVHDWSGVLNEGKPIACTRNVVKAMCLAQPHFYREVMRAIRLASSTGVR